MAAFSVIAVFAKTHGPKGEQTKTAESKSAQKRLTLLQLADKLGEVFKPCRMHKISRSQFYEYKRAVQEHGFEGLVDKPPIPLSHSNQLPKKTRARIIEPSAVPTMVGRHFRATI